MAIHLLGIRHHGPGSARHVKKYIEKLAPDLILVEGPAEAETQLNAILDTAMKPPVALLAYLADAPEHAVFYPFAAFSPEWQAMEYGLKNIVPIRFFDLPLSHSLAIQQQEKNIPQTEPTQEEQEQIESTSEEIIILPEEESTLEITDYIPKDPFDALASAAGVPDAELWWELNFEARYDSGEEIFAAIQEAVTTLRETDNFAPKDTKEALREAFMRKKIREAEKEGFTKIAVICGAWHVPALANMPPKKYDDELLKNLPKAKVEMTWVPWTYSRLSYQSGYGAGILAPGWYEHLWKYPQDDGTRWITKIAKLLRKSKIDTSTAHVIETVRLANAIAAMRHYHRAGLDEINEAVTAVMGFGSTALLDVIYKHLTLNDRIGKVPDNLPKVPLLVDIEKYQKQFRLKPAEASKEIELDLRQTNDLAKSTFLHRLKVLGIEWGSITYSRSKGTFKESWLLNWKPEMVLQIIEKAIYGNTIKDATIKYVTYQLEDITDVYTLVELLDKCILANIPEAVDKMITRLDTLVAESSDIIGMLQSVSSLTNIVRYGNVRNHDLAEVAKMLDSIIIKACINLPVVCSGIDEAAAKQLLELIITTDISINTLDKEELKTVWQDTLYKLYDSESTHAILAGFATRLLYNKHSIDATATALKLSYFLSPTNIPMQVAYWFEGFLTGSATILLYDDELWVILYEWVKELSEESFIELLPLLRRTFATFEEPERKKIGAKAKASASGQVVRTNQQLEATDVDTNRATLPLSTIAMLLGITN